MQIKSLKLHSTMAPNLMIPRKGYIIHLLVEGAPIGATYFDRLPLNMPPLYAYQPKSLTVFNKLLITRTEEVKKNYGSLNVYPVLSQFSNNKTFGFMMETICMYSSVNLFLGSRGFLNPTNEKPWHGGPPAMTSILPLNLIKLSA